MDYCAEEYCVESTSYFWSCITLSEDCPFFSISDPNLCYFGLGLLGLYTVFIIIVLADLKFYWSLDSFQRQIDNYINLVRQKVHRVQMDQRRLMSTQERTEKQLKKSLEGKKTVTTLRAGLLTGDERCFTVHLPTDGDSTRRGLWGVNSVSTF